MLSLLPNRSIIHQVTSSSTVLQPLTTRSYDPSKLISLTSRQNMPPLKNHTKILKLDKKMFLMNDSRPESSISILKNHSCQFPPLSIDNISDHVIQSPIRSPIRSPVRSPIHESDQYPVDSSMSNMYRYRPIKYENSCWKYDTKVARFNKAYELHQIHFDQKLDQQWKTEAVQKLLQMKIIQEGKNVKVGLREIFIINFGEKFRVKHAKKFYGVDSFQRLQVYQYYVPVYRKIHHLEELSKDFEEWMKMIIQVFNLKQQSTNPNFWLLDGQMFDSLDQIPSFEKLIFMSSQEDFDLWEVCGKRHKLDGEFNYEMYEEFLTKVHNLKTNEDVKQFFSRGQNLEEFFQDPDAIEEVIKPHHSKNSSSNRPSLRLIHMQNKRRESILTEKVDNTVQVNNRTFEKMFGLHDAETQGIVVQVVQQLMEQRKDRFTLKIKNLQEALEQRYMNIRLQRERFTKRRIQNQRVKQQLQLKVPKTQDDFEEELLNDDITNIDQIHNDAHAQVHSSLIFHTEKQNPLVSFNLISKMEVFDPFELLKIHDIHKYEGFIGKVNLDKIMMDKNVTRMDAINYLTVFKCLMDSDIFSESQLAKGSNITLPKLFISKKQLVRCIPYVVLYSNNLNVNTYNKIVSSELPYVSFMEFLDVFNSSAHEDQVIDSKSFL